MCIRDRYLISKGAELDYVHPLSKNTAFHLAAFGNHREMATLLAKSGADVNKKLKANVSLLRPFQDANNTDMIAFLTGLGVKDDGCKDVKCFEAVSYTHLDVYKRQGLESVQRVERGIAYFVQTKNGEKLTQDERKALLPLIHDRMTETCLLYTSCVNFLQNLL